MNAVWLLAAKYINDENPKSGQLLIPAKSLRVQARLCLGYIVISCPHENNTQSVIQAIRH